MPRTATDLLDYLSDSATVLPEPFEFDDMVTRVVSLHRQNGGATFSFHFGDVSGQRFYAVAVYVERSVTLPGVRVPLEALRAYIHANRHLLRDVRNNIGTWYNRDLDTTYLDISTTLIDEQEALALADRYNQIAIYDLARGVQTGTGGTGEAFGELPQEDQRLPALIRGEQAVGGR